jgi:hypothetical protein
MSRLLGSPALVLLFAGGPPPQTPVTGEWLLFSTTHFNVLYSRSIGGEVKHVAAEAETEYEQIRGNLHHDLTYKPGLILVSTRQEFQQAVPLGRFTDTRAIVLTLDTPARQRAGELRHELAHVFTFDILPQQSGDLPGWIVEGLAEYERREWGASDVALLKDASRQGAALHMLDVTAPVDSSAPDLDRSLGHAAFDFIETRWGMDGLRQFLFVLSRDGYGDTNLLAKNAFGLTADDFGLAFDRYIRERFLVPEPRPRA